MSTKRKIRKFGEGGGTELTSPSGARYRLPLLDDEDIGGRKSKPPAVRTGEPSGGRLAKRGSTEVVKPGRPSIDVDGRQKRLPGYKQVPVGPEERVKRPALAAPEKPPVSTIPEFTKGLGRKAAMIAGATLIPDITREAPNADKPRTYSGEGLQPAKSKQTASAPALKPASKPAPTASPKPPPAPAPAPKPASTASPAPVPKPPVKSAPAAKKVSNTATKATSSGGGSNRSSKSSDGYMDDLRAAARRMRDTSSEMAEKTGAMKEKMGEFSRSFKKGGSVKSRGDGIAQRGRTKGRFV